MPNPHGISATATLPYVPIRENWAKLDYLPRKNFNILYFNKSWKLILTTLYNQQFFTTLDMHYITLAAPLDS